MVPESCPSFPQRVEHDFAPTPGCALSQGGCPEPLHHPPSQGCNTAPPLPLPGAGNKPQPWAAVTPTLLPTSHGAETPQPGDAGLDVAPALQWDQCSRKGAGKQILSFLGCKCPWTRPLPALLLAHSHGPAGSDARDSSVASWAPFLPGCTERVLALIENGAGGGQTQH